MSTIMTSTAYDGTPPVGSELVPGGRWDYARKTGKRIKELDQLHIYSGPAKNRSSVDWACRHLHEELINSSSEFLSIFTNQTEGWEMSCTIVCPSRMGWSVSYLVRRLLTRPCNSYPTLGANRTFHAGKYRANEVVSLTFVDAPIVSWMAWRSDHRNPSSYGFLHQILCDSF
jgi:hypothetical protein